MFREGYPLIQTPPHTWNELTSPTGETAHKRQNYETGKSYQTDDYCYYGSSIVGVSGYFAIDWQTTVVY